MFDVFNYSVFPVLLFIFSWFSRFRSLPFASPWLSSPWLSSSVSHYLLLTRVFIWFVPLTLWQFINVFWLVFQQFPGVYHPCFPWTLHVSGLWIVDLFARVGTAFPFFLLSCFIAACLFTTQTLSFCPSWLSLQIAELNLLCFWVCIWAQSTIFLLPNQQPLLLKPTMSALSLATCSSFSFTSSSLLSAATDSDASFSFWRPVFILKRINVEQNFQEELHSDIIFGPLSSRWWKYLHIF